MALNKHGVHLISFGACNRLIVSSAHFEHIWRHMVLLDILHWQLPILQSWEDGNKNVVDCALACACPKTHWIDLCKICVTRGIKCNCFRNTHNTIQAVSNAVASSVTIRRSISDETATKFTEIVCRAMQITQTGYYFKTKEGLAISAILGFSVEATDSR